MIYLCAMLGLAGGFAAFLALSEIITITLCFAIYKFNKGKRNFKQYVKWWMA